ncbi:MAG: VOC family protein [Planctomycetaceae bacterium]
MIDARNSGEFHYTWAFDNGWSPLHTDLFGDVLLSKTAFVLSLFSGDCMKFGYTIVYVADVEQSLKFFEAAFGLQRRFLHESGMYGELQTGETTLAFASHDVAAMHFEEPLVRADESPRPLGMEIALVTDDVARFHQNAITHGAKELCPPQAKPWGQVVSYVRAPDGTLVELCTPVTG